MKLGGYLLLVVGVCVPSTSWANPSLQATLLKVHNLERQEVGLGPVAWDAQLAAAAAGYASELARKDHWGHSDWNTRVGQGENLWMGTRGAFNSHYMVGEWAAEKAAFRPGVFPNVSRTGSWSDVAHYTQMVWPSTNKVGCAVRSSARWDYLVCRYSGVGNVMGQRVGPIRVAARR
jgi:hypothetical protein